MWTQAKVQGQVREIEALKLDPGCASAAGPRARGVGIMADLNLRLRVAARDGNIEEMRALIAAGADVRGFGPAGTALH